MEKKTIVARAEVLAGKEKEFMTAATALIEGKREVANSYSPSDIMQRIVVSTNMEKLSWQNGLKLIWDERVIHNNEQ